MSLACIKSWFCCCCSSDAPIEKTKKLRKDSSSGIKVVQENEVELCVRNNVFFVNNSVPFAVRPLFDHAVKKLNSDIFTVAGNIAILTDSTFQIIAGSITGIPETGYTQREILALNMVDLLLTSPGRSTIEKAANLQSLINEHGFMFERSIVQMKSADHSIKNVKCRIAIFPLNSYFVVTLKKIHEFAPANPDDDEYAMKQFEDALYDKVMPSEVSCTPAGISYYNGETVTSRSEIFKRVIVAIGSSDYRNNSDIFFLCDLNFIVLAVNDNLKKITGYQPINVIYQGINSLFINDGQEMLSLQTLNDNTLQEPIKAKLLTKGYDLNRFKKNSIPVMLYIKKAIDTEDNPYFLIQVTHAQSPGEIEFERKKRAESSGVPILNMPSWVPPVDNDFSVHMRTRTKTPQNLEFPPRLGSPSTQSSLVDFPKLDRATPTASLRNDSAADVVFHTDTSPAETPTPEQGGKYKIKIYPPPNAPRIDSTTPENDEVSVLNLPDNPFNLEG